MTMQFPPNEVKIPASYNVEIDALVMDEASRVDWHKVTEAEASRFGLAVGVYNEVFNVYHLRRSAAGTAIGSLITVSVLTFVSWLIGVNGWIAAAAVITSLVVRTLQLSFLSRQSWNNIKQFEEQLLEVTRELARLHPND